MTDLTDVVAKWKQLQGFHEWLVERRSNNEPLPETREELNYLYRTERPAFLMKRPYTQTFSKR